MQDCVITANTLLTARLFRPIEGSVKDCEKGHEIDEFGICKHCGTHFDEILDGFREEFNRCVTTVGVNAIVDAFQGTFTLSDFKYHDAGTGTGAEAVGDVALGTPWDTRAVCNFATAACRSGGSASDITTAIYPTHNRL